MLIIAWQNLFCHYRRFLWSEKEAESMKSTQIRLSGVEDVRTFVEAAGRCDFDIEVKYNRISVDAKSMLGVMSICSNPFWVCTDGVDDHFEALLEKFRAE